MRAIHFYMSIYLSIGEADKHFLRKSIKSRLRVYNIGKTIRKKKRHMTLKEKIGNTLAHLTYQGN